jgi:acyl-CoA thioesterase-1
MGAGSALVVVALVLVGCNSQSQPDTRSYENQAAQVQPPAPPPNAAQVAAKPDDKRPVIVAFGDSLSAGLGLRARDAYPEVLQRLLDDQHYAYRVVNAGVSGDTTTDGVERLPDVVALHPAVVILEFGANDGLRGVPVTEAYKNLEVLTEGLKKAGAKVLLAGMTLPRNYGPEYIHAFEEMYPQVEKKYHVARMPFFLQDVGGHPELTQPDGLHPTAEGARIIAKNLMSYLTPLLNK